MILLDTSVWIDHLDRSDDEARLLLSKRVVLTHPWVIGELRMGRVAQRQATFAALSELPRARVASASEIGDLVERHRLYGRGIGYVDAGLLASTLITPGARLLTRDRRLAEVADELGCAC